MAICKVAVTGFDVWVRIAWVAWVEFWVGFEAGTDDEGCCGWEMGGVAYVVPVVVTEDKLRVNGCV